MSNTFSNNDQEARDSKSSELPDPINGALRTFNNFKAYSNEVMQVYELSRDAIISQVDRPKLERLLQDIQIETGRAESDDERMLLAQRMTFATKMSDGAQREIDNGFFILISHSCTALWSALESGIMEYCRQVIVCFPNFLNTERLSRTKVPASAMIGKDYYLQASAIIDEIERNTASHLKPGIGRFTETLASVGLDFPIDDENRKRLFELSKVRNLIVHRASVVDGKFKEDCPWRQEKIGDRIQISEQDLAAYYGASIDFFSKALLATAARVRKDGTDPDRAFL